jgi:hypothetical protein
LSKRAIPGPKCKLLGKPTGQKSEIVIEVVEKNEVSVSDDSETENDAKINALFTHNLSPDYYGNEKSAYETRESRRALPIQNELGKNDS